MRSDTEMGASSMEGERPLRDLLRVVILPKVGGEEQQRARSRFSLLDNHFRRERQAKQNLFHKCNYKNIQQRGTTFARSSARRSSAGSQSRRTATSFPAFVSQLHLWRAELRQLFRLQHLPPQHLPRQHLPRQHLRPSRLLPAPARRAHISNQIKSNQIKSNQIKSNQCSREASDG